MGPLTVVDPEPGVGEGAQLRDRFKEVRVQHLCSVAPIETFDVRVLIRLSWLDVVRGHAVLGTPIDEGLRREFGAVVGLYHMYAKRQALEDIVDEANGCRLVARVEDLQHTDAGAVIDRRELIEALATPGNTLKKLHIHLQTMTGLRLLIPLPPLPARARCF